MDNLDWLRTTLDCGDNSCLFIGPEQRKGMRTNGGCRCFKTLPQTHRIFINRMFHVVSSLTKFEEEEVMREIAWEDKVKQLEAELKTKQEKSVAEGILLVLDIAYRENAFGWTEVEYILETCPVTREETEGLNLFEEFKERLDDWLDRREAEAAEESEAMSGKS